MLRGVSPRLYLVSLLLTACGAATQSLPVPAGEVVDASDAGPAAPLFAATRALSLRASRGRDQPPFTIELAEDGAIALTRCGATRLSREGVLERDDGPVARVVRDAERLLLLLPDGRPTGLFIEGSTLFGRGDARFMIAADQIIASDAELPAITVDPSGSDATLALALLGLVLVCDDLSP